MKFNRENPKVGVYDISNEVYHRSYAASSTGLKLINKSIAHYKAPRVKETKSLNIGRVTHTQTLEPDTFLSNYLLTPKIKRSEIKSIIKGIEFFCDEGEIDFDAKKYEDKKIKELKIEFDEISKKVLGERDSVDEETFSKINKMVESVFSNKSARALLEAKGAAEKSFFYEVDGIKAKVRPDYLLQTCIIDLKTTKDASPEGFSKAIYNFGYHISAAMYLDGVNSVRPKSVEDFYFIAVENQEPYICEVYQLSEESLAEGHGVYKSAIQKLIAYRKDRSIASGYTDGGFNEISIPRWGYKNKTY